MSMAGENSLEFLADGVGSALTESLDLFSFLSLGQIEVVVNSLDFVGEVLSFFGQSSDLLVESGFELLVLVLVLGLPFRIELLVLFWKVDYELFNGSAELLLGKSSVVEDLVVLCDLGLVKSLEETGAFMAGVKFAPFTMG